MHKTFGRTILALAIAAPFAIGWRPADPGLTLQPKSRMWVSGTSTIKNFDCEAPTMTVAVATTLPDPVHAVSAGAKAVGKVDVTVAVAAMDCANATMNGHMQEALKGANNPVITFGLDSYSLVMSGDSVAVTLNGSLMIAGSTKAIVVTAEAKDVGSGVLRVSGVYDVHMKDFGLTPPTLMLGTLKVGEKVQVHFDLLLKSQGDT